MLVSASRRAPGLPTCLLQLQFYSTEWKREKARKGPSFPIVSFIIKFCIPSKGTLIEN